MDYSTLIFDAGASIGQSLIVFLLIALFFDFLRKMLYTER